MLTTVAAGRVYDFSHTVGRFAQGGGLGFQQPRNIALGEDDKVYVVNRSGGDRTYVVDRGSEGVGTVNTGTRISMITIGPVPGDEEFIGEFRAEGNATGHMVWPSGIVLDKEQKIYISDEWLNEVLIFDEAGIFLSHWSALERENGQAHGVASIVMDAEENLYVSDGRSHQIRKFTKDGKFLTGWGSHGTGKGEFDSPWGITCDEQGCVYVADFKNHRVQKFSPEGDWMADFGGPEPVETGLFRPTAVAVDPDGDVYVSDWGSNGTNPGRVQIYDSEGQFITGLIGDSVELSKWGQIQVNSNPDTQKARRKVSSFVPQYRFALPAGLVFDAQKSRLLVPDPNRHRIQIYNKLSEYQDSPMNL